MVKFEVEITAEEYIRLNYRIVYANPVVLIALAACAIVVGTNLTSGGWDALTKGPADIIALFALGYLLLFLPVTLFYRVRGLYYRMAALNEKQVFTVDETGVNIKGQTFDVKNEWSAYKTIELKKDWMVLWKAKNFGNFVPLRSFKNPEEIEQFIAMAKERGIVVKGKLPAK